MEKGRYPAAKNAVGLRIDEESSMQCDQADARVEQVRATTNRMAELVNEAYSDGYQEALEALENYRNKPVTKREQVLGSILLFGILAGVFLAGFATAMICCGI